MNIFSYKKIKNISVSTFFIYLSLVFSSLKSQNFEYGSPFVQYFPPKEYGYESQNFSITKDKAGILYFGNLSGILQFDGKYWTLFKYNGVPVLATDKNGVVYAGGLNDFGYFTNDLNYKLKYVSLAAKLNSGDPVGTINKIICVNKLSIFCTTNSIYSWDGQSVELLNSSNQYITAFKVNEELYVFKYGSGLYKYTNNVFKFVPNGNFFKDKLITDILPYGNKLLIRINNQDGFLLYDYNQISEYYPSYSTFLDQNNYVKGIELSNGRYAFGTKNCGIIVADRYGKLLCTINKQNGLYNDNINDIFNDSDNNLWIALNNGIAKAEIPTPYTIFNENNGLKGGVYSIIRYNGVLYVSTSSGLFYFNAQTPVVKNDVTDCIQSVSFFPVAGINTQCYNLYDIDGHLFVTSDIGVFEVIDNVGYRKTYGLLKPMLQSKKNPENIFLGMYDGIHVLELNSGVFNEIGKIKNFNKYVRTMVEDENGDLWLGSDYLGVIKLHFNEDILSPEIENYSTGYGLPKDFDWVDVYKTHKNVLFSTYKGLFIFNSKTNKFEPDKTTGLNTPDGNRWFYPIVEDKFDNLYYSSGFHDQFKKISGILKIDTKKKEYYRHNINFQKLSNFTVETIYPDKDSVVWFGGFDGLIRFSENEFVKDSIAVKTLLKKIIIGKDSVICYGNNYYWSNDSVIKYYSDTAIKEFGKKNNKIHFEFSAPFYEINGELLYSYFLENFDEEWSAWSNTNSKEYTNLPPGEYTFFVKAKCAHGSIATPAAYKFIVLPPFYLKWWFFVIVFLLLSSFMIMIIRWRNYFFEKEKNRLEKVIAERTEELVKEKERAEELINNILPKQTAEEIKTTGKVKRKRFRLVTVLFSDVQGFTKIAQSIGQDALLNELDKYFLKFDTVVETYNIEKIKTIGDAYMCAGGIPQKNRTNPVEVVLAALEMREYMHELKKKHENIWNIRIGIHTGEVIAGIVGSKKYSYDIWGDAVNVASRMESLGEPGEIHISQSTYELVKEFFDCEFRGKIPVKYHGEIGTYYVKGIRPEYSENGLGKLPNRKFLLKLQYIRFDDLDEFIMNRLEKGLNPDYFYHDLKHTIDVCTQVEILGRAERINEEDMLLLKTAALFHDTGFLIGYEDHEFLGIKMAKDILPKFQYNDDQIKIICDLIYATKLPPIPKNLLEQIICDADLDYLGRPDFGPVSQALFYELIKMKKIRSLNDWNKMQVKFIESHQYFTETARRKRSVNKMQQLDELKKVVEIIRQQEEMEKKKK